MIALTLVALVVVQLVGYLSFRGEREEFVSRIVTDYMAQSVQAVDRALALMHRHRTLEDSVARARRFADDARAALAIFPPSKARDALLGIVAFCVEREY